MRIKIAVLSLVAVAFAVGGIAYAKSQVPLKIRGIVGLTSSEIVDQSDDDLIVVRNGFEGTVNGNQLGRCIFEGVQTLTVATEDAEDYVDTFTPVAATFTNTETFTAANGDVLDVTTAGVYFIYVFTDLNCSCGFQFVPILGFGESEITGGTGRFAGATGTLDVTTGLNDDFQVTYESEGTISSLGSRGGNGKK